MFFDDSSVVFPPLYSAFFRTKLADSAICIRQDTVTISAKLNAMFLSFGFALARSRESLSPANRFYGVGRQTQRPPNEAVRIVESPQLCDPL